MVNGRKTFITNGPVADFVALAAQTAPEQGRQGISLLVVDRTRRATGRARTLDKMGWHTSETAELVFHRLPGAGGRSSSARKTKAFIT